MLLGLLAVSIALASADAPNRIQWVYNGTGCPFGSVKVFQDADDFFESVTIKFSSFVAREGYGIAPDMHVAVCNVTLTIPGGIHSFEYTDSTFFSEVSVGEDHTAAFIETFQPFDGEGILQWPHTWAGSDPQKPYEPSQRHVLAGGAMAQPVRASSCGDTVAVLDLEVRVDRTGGVVLGMPPLPVE